MRNLVWPLALLMAVTIPGNRSNAQSRAPSTQGPLAYSASETPVDINHAGLNDLVKVPGMTPVWAKRILRFRPYRTKQDLLDRGVVSSEVYERIREHIIAHRDKQ